MALWVLKCKVLNKSPLVEISPHTAELGLRNPTSFWVKFLKLYCVGFTRTSPDFLVKTRYIDSLQLYTEDFLAQVGLTTQV